MPNTKKGVIPEKHLHPATNYYLSRFEVSPPTCVGVNEKKETSRRAQRDSAEKTSKFGL
jgi:hypothetical protein